MKVKELRPPIGIIISHPITFFKEYDEKKWLAKMQELNTDDTKTWTRVMKNLPTHDFLYIYTAYHGKVQHRTNLVELFRGKDVKFPRPEGGIKSFTNANGIIMGGPYVKAPYDIPMKGFQGFRYVYDPLF